MIGRLHGVLLEKQPPQILLDVHGVGYEIEAPMSTFYHLPEIGESITLHTHFVVREDAQLLYGFYHARERQLFRHLIKVNGVGPKLALTILSGIEPDRFVICVMQDDASSLTRLPGVGKKTAERLLIEMRDKLKAWQTESVPVNIGKTAQSVADEAVAALIALGYKPQEASRAISQVAEDGLSVEAVIKAALQGIMA